MVLEPRRIEDGWMKRWVKQVFELYWRAPWMPTLILALTTTGLYGIALLPYYLIGLFFPFAVFMVAVNYSMLRALDQHPVHPLYATYQYLMSAIKDIYGILVYATVFVIIFTSIGIIVNQFSIYVAPIIARMIHTAPQNTIHFSRLSYVIVMEFESIFALASLETPLFITYLTMLYGHNYAENHMISIKALWTNIHVIPVGLFAFVGMDALIWLPALNIKSPQINWLIIIIMGVMFTLFCAFGYMASREMFESLTENAPQQVKETTNQHVHAAG